MMRGLVNSVGEAAGLHGWFEPGWGGEEWVAILIGAALLAPAFRDLRRRWLERRRGRAAAGREVPVREPAVWHAGD